MEHTVLVPYVFMSFSKKQSEICETSVISMSYEVCYIPNFMYMFFSHSKVNKPLQYSQQSIS